jgi:DNA replication protein DnaC
MENGKNCTPLDKIMRETLERIEARQREEQDKWDALPEAEKQRVLDERRRAEEAEKHRVLIASYQSKGIPPRFYDSTWDNWLADSEAKKQALQAVRSGAWNTNLFLCGKSGTGKTHIAMCLAKDGATYRRLPDIFREIRENLDSEQAAIDRYGSMKLLVIDEVGRQKFSPFEKNLFFEIIDKRWNNVLPSTLVTNMSEKEFCAEYGTAVLDRLRPVLVRFDWESRRETLNVPAQAGTGF